MKLLVATSHAFVLVIPEESVGYIIHSGRGAYYGITYTPACIFVGARNMWDDTPESTARSTGSILVFNYDLELIGELISPHAIRGMHQIVHTHADLYVTGTFDDTILVWNGDMWSCWSPVAPKPKASRAAGGWHLNSIFATADSLYVLAHNFGQSEVFKYDGNTRQLVDSRRLGVEAHNLWLMDGRLCTCSSGEHCLRSEETMLAHTGGFPRGIAVTDREIFVGVSKYLMNRLARKAQDCFIIHYDRSWQLRGCHILRNLGNIHEIRTPGCYDAAHPLHIGCSLESWRPSDKVTRIKCDTGAI